MAALQPALSRDFLHHVYENPAIWKSFLTYTPVPHWVDLAQWLSRTVYVPGGLGFEPQCLHMFFGL